MDSTNFVLSSEATSIESSVSLMKATWLFFSMDFKRSARRLQERKLKEPND